MVLVLRCRSVLSVSVTLMNIVDSLHLFLFSVNRNVLITKVELQSMEYNILSIHYKISPITPPHATI